MFPLIGLLVVIGSVAGGFAWGGGHFGTLFQPSEFLIIGGAAFGAFLIATPPATVFATLKTLPKIFMPPKYNKKSFAETLAMLFALFAMLASFGIGCGTQINAIAEVIETNLPIGIPANSEIFKQFPTIMKNAEAMDFLCGHLRLLTFGSPEPHEIEAVIDMEIETIEHEKMEMSAALNRVADGCPGLGIVAAVLGVIHTMGAINEPPEVLGHLIAAALVGTFFGVLLAYGFIAPLSNAVANVTVPELEYLKVIRAGLMGHIQGYAPQISVEFARKALPHDIRPTFAEVDKMCQELKMPNG